MLSSHEAGRLCGVAQKVVATNVGLSFKEGGKERVDHLGLSGFATAEPSFEGKTMSVGGLARLSSKVAS
jgi:hypothetical protein